MVNLVSVKWLKENILREDLVIVDCRFDLMNKSYGKEAYERSHIKGAQRIDIETQLSSDIVEHGGRHPLPTVDELKLNFESIGINSNSTVVAYDDGNLAGASRLWWILKYLGHKNVHVLDGGISLFEKMGGNVSDKLETPKKGTLDIDVQSDMKVDMEYVRERINNDKVALVDSREYKRYIGEFEPVDKKAGHIPGAINYFWMDILQSEGELLNIKSKDELNLYFDKLRDFEEVIVYCGSGITACPNSLALSEIGLKHKVYAGSFSDWISYEENKVEV